MQGNKLLGDIKQQALPRLQRSFSNAWWAFARAFRLYAMFFFFFLTSGPVWGPELENTHLRSLLVMMIETPDRTSGKLSRASTVAVGG